MEHQSRSSQAWYLRVRRTLIWLAVVGLLSAMGTQMLIGAFTDSATSDEQIHILSGYTTLTQGHILFDPEHPFLPKALAALPLLWIQPAVPSDARHLTSEQARITYNTYKEANVWGFDLLFTQGNNPDLILLATRSVVILLTLALGGVLFWWSRQLFGSGAALIILAIFSFEPTFIAHGHLVNDDTIAALAFVLSLATFHRYLYQPSYRTLAIAGLTLGIGLITKFSLLALGPIFIALLVVWLIYARQTQATPPITIFPQLGRAWQRYLAGLLGIFLISWAIIWISYGALFIINPAQNPLVPAPASGLVGTLLSHTTPGMYAKGAALVLPSNISHNRHGYLLGQCYEGSRWDYFPVLLLFKTPLPTLALLLLSLALWWRREPRSFTLPFLITPIVLYLAFSSFSGINIGIRHILPVYALILMAIGWAARGITIQTFRQDNRVRAHAILITLLLLAQAGSVIATAPNYLPYYNLLAQEPRAVPYISNDSNVDWGQATRQLATYLQVHHINHIALDNFNGFGEARYREIPFEEANPANHHYQGYIAISRSTIIDHKCTKQNDWGWLVDQQPPVAIIGNAINLYKIGG